VNRHPLLVDAHVHLYECFDPARFLRCAFENFRREGERRGDATEFTGMLCLTEKAEHHWFTALLHDADDRGNDGPNGAWRFSRTEEPCSVVARGPDGEQLVLVAGRQIISAENVEILAIGTPSEFKDGVPAAGALDAVRAEGGTPVIPWGFGKWSGRRGAILDDWLRSESADRFFLGDNSGRPWFFPRPAHFKRAAAKGIRVLPGSDPLPFPSQERKPGSFGFAIQWAADLRRPAAQLQRMLADRTISLEPYGPLERLGNFVRNQLAMQIDKRKRQPVQPPSSGPDRNGTVKGA
jgi:hypothetical protein